MTKLKCIIKLDLWNLLVWSVKFLPLLIGIVVGIADAMTEAYYIKTLGATTDRLVIEIEAAWRSIVYGTFLTLEIVWYLLIMYMERLQEVSPNDKLVFKNILCKILLIKFKLEHHNVI